jgi:hypothetical protein
LSRPNTSGRDHPSGYEFANHRGGWCADISALREHRSDLMDFTTWLAYEGTQRYSSLAA